MEPLKVKGGIIKEGVLYLHLPSLKTQIVHVIVDSDIMKGNMKVNEALHWDSQGPVLDTRTR